MNNHQIVALLNANPHTKGFFGGVYSSDNVPVIPVHEPTAYVINLDPSTQPGSHWISVITGPGKFISEYYDSYGQEPKLTRIKKLLGDVYIYNNKQIQSILTTVCGQHCLYFILGRSLKKSMSTIISSYPDPPLANDIFVNKIVERAFSANLNIIHTKFLHKQISRAWRN